MEKLGAKTKELTIQMCYAIGGSFLFTLGINLLMVPMGLYNGGFMGMAQLIRTFLVSGLNLPIPPSVDIAGIIYFMINVPLFYMGFRIMGLEFTIKTLVTVGINSLMLVLVPIPETPIIQDTLTGSIIAGIIAGIGVGLVLRGRSSGGGQDIIGVCCSKRYPNVSVGRINIMMNIVVYGICLFMFDMETVVYSLIFATVQAVAIDRVHIQNINTSVIIITKQLGISKAIMEQMGRGVTNWDGQGAYTQKTAYILLVMISKYEVAQIKKIVHSIDPHAFMIFTEGCSVEGNFEKRL